MPGEYPPFPPPPPPEKPPGGEKLEKERIKTAIEKLREEIEKKIKDYIFEFQQLPPDLDEAYRQLQEKLANKDNLSLAELEKVRQKLAWLKEELTRRRNLNSPVPPQI